MRRTTLRLLAGAVTATGLTALLAAPAFAHVTVNAPGATQGGYIKLTFRVPTELDQPTTKLEIVFPTDAPLANASVKPHPGWTYQVTKAKPAAPLTDDDGNTVDEVVSSITWTATGAGIGPGEFDEFEVSAGPLPKADSMTFKALQTYKDGTVVRWIEPASEGSEPEHPAPVLALTAGGDGHDDMSASPTATATTDNETGSATPASEQDDEGSSSVVAWVALGVGAVALVLAGAGFVAARRPRS